MNAVAANLREDQSMPTRRSFVTSTLGAGAALATQRPHKAAAQVNRRIENVQTASANDSVT